MGLEVIYIIHQLGNESVKDDSISLRHESSTNGKSISLPQITIENVSIPDDYCERKTYSIESKTEKRLDRSAEMNMLLEQRAEQ